MVIIVMATFYKDFSNVELTKPKILLKNEALINDQEA
jgi:hypothetical protein